MCGRTSSYEQSWLHYFDQLQSGIRKAFLKAMGITDHTDLPHPLRPEGLFWVQDPETDGGRLLRPNWKISFANNSPWHKYLTEYVKKKAPDCWHLATKELMAKTSDRRILACLSTTFKTWATSYKAKWKGIDPLAGQTEDQNNDEKKKRDDQQNRRRARKIKVCSGSARHVTLTDLEINLESTRTHRSPPTLHPWGSRMELSV